MSSLSRLRILLLWATLAGALLTASAGPSLRVSPAPPEVLSSPGEGVRLTCRSNINPSICLWKTPYQAIYSIGGGRVWEDGRISSPPSSDSCALLIQAVQLKDEGIWQCEVGAVVDGEFTTTTAETSLTVVSRGGGGGGGGDSRLVGLEGAEIVVRCGGGRGGRTGPCRWTSPSGHTFSLQPGDYAERGRLQADQQCGLRISSLQDRDEGSWSCQANTESGRVVETRTNLVIETPLKLSAPTSILQQADERATLVCHANKQYETCEWETPYGRTVTFSKHTRNAESGRLQYFGFSDMDCGIVIKDIGVRDSGGWTCRVSASVAGRQQTSADIVRLFVEPTQYEYPQEEPRSIQSSSPDYTIDYTALDYNQEESKMDDYDAFDYVNGDFDKVVKGSNNNKDTSNTFPPKHKGVTEQAVIPVEPQAVHKTIEEDDGFIRETQIFGKFGTVRIDKIPETTERNVSSRNPLSSTVASVATQADKSIEPIFHPEDETLEDHTVSSSLKPKELDFLALISGSRVDNRPFKIKNDSTEFGSRHVSTSGSRFQFGNVQLVEEKQEDQIRSGVPRAFPPSDQTQNGFPERGGQSERRKIAEERQKQLAEEERERMEKIRKEKEREEEALRRRKEQEEQKRLEEDKRRQQLEEDRRRKEIIEKLKKEREEQLRQGREQEEREKKLKEQREKEMRAEREKQIREEREKQLREQREKEIRAEREKQLREEREKQLREQREKELRAEREKQIREEREKQLKEQREKELRAEREKKLREEREKQLKEQREKELIAQREKELREEREKQLREQREKEMRAEREKQIREEREKKRREEREKQIREQREKQLREERERRLRDERDRKRKEEIEQKRIEEEQEEQRRIEEATKKKIEENKRLKEIEQKRDQERQKEIEERRSQERERIRGELLDQKRKQEEEERLEKIRIEKQRKIDEEKERRRQEELRRIQEENEKAEKEQREAERKLRLEEQRIKQEEIENKRKQYEEMKRREEEEAKLKKMQEEREEEERQKLEKIKKEEEERKRKEEEEIERIRKLVEERRKEIVRLREEQAEKDRILQQERARAQKEIEEEKRQKQQEIEMIRRRDEERKKELDRLRELQAERERLLEEEKAKVQRENDLQRKREEEENDKLRQQAIERKMEIEKLKALQLEREAQLKNERERIRQQKLELEKQQVELQRQKELLETIRRDQDKPKPTTPDPTTADPPKQLRKCLINPWPEGGNITCPNSPIARGKFIVTSGTTCTLACNTGYVTLDAKRSQCYDGRLSRDLGCVLPGAMIVVGGRSNSLGVLSSVELITSGGVCNNIVPDIPSMRWKMISASINNDLIVACGGINFLGDPKTDCWKLDFTFSKPRWTSMQSLSVPRDAAGWAAEQGKLYVMGGSLGTLSGYTASTEVYDPATDQWTVGVSLTTTRASHCAVGDGQGNIIVTGGYGALDLVQRLEISSGQWTRLPDLQPVRAQHGCALVSLRGERGVMVVGGDSGGTRLSDVRFLPLDLPPRLQSWTKIADLNTARWGRPSVGLIGGRVTVIGGWDGVKTLSSVETYDEKNERWQTERRTKLSVDRRWAGSTQVSHKLFPTCIQRRS